MQVGITTFHNAHNYGAMLQAYGLQEAIRTLGFAPQFVNLHPDSLDAQNRKLTPIQNLSDLLKRLLVILYHHKLSARYINFEAFKKAYLHLGRTYTTIEQLRGDPPIFDRLVCGSDQIWNVEQGVSSYFFLDYAPAKARRISYAPSFGVEDVSQCFDPVIRQLLKGFSAISVREKSGAAIVERITGKTPDVVLDPVFLLPKDEWSKIVKAPTFQGKYIAFYSLEVSRGLSDLVSKASRALKMPIVVLGKPGAYIYRNKCILKIDSGPAEFLGWVANATAVITNSFHATSFAIIFNIPFIVYPHATRNTRIEHILEVAGMRSRLLQRGEIDQRVLISLLTTPPHDGRLPTNLENLRSASLEFLHRSLS